jgi:hypothetical protein
MDTKEENTHWNPTTDMCMPCHVRYNRIIKVETFDHDNAWVILNKLKPYQRGLATAVNVVSRPWGNTPKRAKGDTLTPSGKRMEGYNNVNTSSLSYFTSSIS